MAEETPKMKWVVDHTKVGTKGYPRHWKELGLTPPLKQVPIEEHGQDWDGPVPEETNE